MSKKALLVGINKYPVGNELHGCVNDVTEIRDLLMQKHGYTSDDIRFVTDAKATHAGILKGLEWLAAGAGEGDTRLFYYSGHGTWVADASGDEPDGRDECLVPVDYFATETPLLDDTLHKAYLPMLSNKAHLLMVMDSCHSGTVARGPHEGSLFRFVKPKKLEYLKAWYAKEAADTKKEAEITAMVNAKAQELDGKHLDKKELSDAIQGLVKSAIRSYQKRHFTLESVSGTGVLLAGCQDKQTSEERSFGGKRHGALTYYLLKALSGDVPTYGKLVETISANLEDNEFAQVPNLQCSKASRALKFLRWA